MSLLIKKLISRSLKQINEIDNEIKKQSHNPSPIFKSFDKELIKDVNNTEKSIEKIRSSIQSTKK